MAEVIVIAMLIFCTSRDPVRFKSGTVR